MAQEITLGYFTNKTLTYAVFQPDGTVRTAAGTSLPESEIGVSGYYVATDANIIAGDFVIVKEGTIIRFQGQYKPEIDTVILEKPNEAIVYDMRQSPVVFDMRPI